MSFDDLNDVETGSFTSSSSDFSFTTSSSEFIYLTSSISEIISTITANVSLIHRYIGVHRTIHDTEKLRSSLMDAFTKTRDISKQLVPDIRKLAQWDDVGPSEKYEQEKLTGEFQRAITDFQHAQRLAVEKQVDYVKCCRDAIERERAECEAQRRRGSHHSHRQLDYSSQSVIDLDERSLEGRDRDIKHIEEGIAEINQIFRDLGCIVVEHGSVSGTRGHFSNLIALGFVGEDRTSNKVRTFSSLILKNLYALGWTLFILCLVIGIGALAIIVAL
jgi:syntaxin 7